MSSELVAVPGHTTTHVTLEWVTPAVCAGVDCIHHHTAAVDVACLAMVPRATAAATATWW